MLSRRGAAKAVVTLAAGATLLSDKIQAFLLGADTHPHPPNAFPDGLSGAPTANAKTVRKNNLLGTPILGITNNGSGLIRVQVNDTSAWTTLQQLSVFGVAGNTNATGRWKLTVVDATHVDLQGSTFANAAGAGGTIGYVLRPPWNVAGVDYPVGPNFVPTSNPVNIPGASVSGNDIQLFNAGPITIDGYDFSLNGGYRVICSGAGAVTFRNCYWKPTTATFGNMVQVEGGNVTIQYCGIECNKHLIGNGGAPNYYIACRGALNNVVTVQYCYMTQGFAMFIGEGSGPGCFASIKYNFFQNEGYGEYVNGDHADIIQFFGQSLMNQITIDFNTYLHNTVGVGANVAASTQGYSMYVTTSATCVYSMSNNTCVGAISPADSGANDVNNINQWFLPDPTNYGNTTSPMIISQNYCDCTVLNGGSVGGAGSFGGYGAGNWITMGDTTGRGPNNGTLNGSGNKNMVDGSALTIVSQGLNYLINGQYTEGGGATSLGVVNITA